MLGELLQAAGPLKCAVVEAQHTQRPRNRRKHGGLDGGPTPVAKFNRSPISVLPLASLIFPTGHVRLISAGDRETKRGAETAGLRGPVVVAVVAAARLSFLGHLRLPVTSFTSVTHSSSEGEAARAWQVGGGSWDCGRLLSLKRWVFHSQAEVLLSLFTN